MSSLRAAGADGFYLDPNKLDPRRGRGSANAIAGSHPLGVRAKRLRSEGVLTIRFEMPYDSTCLGCGAQVKHGVRFNAAKSAAGAYLSTQIWEFRMRCVSHSGCRTEFLIRTDPERGSYDFVEGIVRRTTDFVPGADDGLGRAGGSLFEAASAASAARAAGGGGGGGGGGDGMAALQHKHDDAARAAAAEACYNAMREDASRRYGDRGPSGAHGAAMSEWRSRAVAAEAAVATGAARGLLVPLAPPLGDEEEAEVRNAFRAARPTPPEQRVRSISVLDGLFFPRMSQKVAILSSPQPPPPPPPPLPPPRMMPTGVAAIVAAGLAVSAADKIYRAAAPKADALAIAARLRASSGAASHGGAGPRVTLRAGPALPLKTISSSLAKGRFVRI